MSKKIKMDQYYKQSTMVEADDSSDEKYTGCHGAVVSDVRYFSLFLHPVWKYIEKYLDYNDILSLGSTSMYARNSIYSLCTKLTLTNPNYYRGQRNHVFESPEFVIKQFTNIKSLTIIKSAVKLDFLKNENLNNLKEITLPSKYFSIARQWLPMSLTALKIYKRGLTSTSNPAVFDNTKTFKELQKLEIVRVPINDRSLTFLPESLQYLKLNLPENSRNQNYNFDITHLVNLKVLHCRLTHCRTIKLPINLEQMYLRGFHDLKDTTLNVSNLFHLKVFDLIESNITNLVLPVNLEEIKIDFCHHVKTLLISNFIHLKHIILNFNLNLSTIALPHYNLEKLRIEACGALKKIDISHLINLKTFELNTMYKLESLILPPTLVDVYIQNCNIRVINEKEIICDFLPDNIKLYSHCIQIKSIKK